MYIKLVLQSDLCIGTGESISGVIDTEVAFDKYGVPYIPSKRIKGCLKEMAEEIANLLKKPSYDESFDRVFGSSGKGYSDSLRIENGYIKNYKQIVDGIQKGLDDTSYNIFFQQQNIRENFTYIRTKTRIDRTTGTAEKNSLRTTRVIKKGVEFYFDVRNIQKDDIDFLKKACKLLRHIGINRTRGLGEVKCELIDVEGSVSKGAFNCEPINDDHQGTVSYTLKLLSSVILPISPKNINESEHYIPGSVMMGYFAKMFIQQNSLGNDAHRNKEFKKLFINGDIKFSNAYLTDDEHNDYIPCPVNIVKDKNTFDYLDISVEEVEKKTLLHNAFINIEGESLNIKKAETQIEYHHMRPKDKTIGHVINNDLLDGGQFFSYTSLNEGQLFKGKITGKGADITSILKLLPSDNIINIGKSKTAQYSSAQLNIENIEKQEYAPLHLENGQEFKVILFSPMILMNEFGHVEPNPLLLKEMIEEDIPDLEIVQEYLKFKTISGFHGKWVLPKQQLRALDAGATLIFRYNGKEMAGPDITRKLYGLRTNEGFGEIKLYTEDKTRFSKGQSYGIRNNGFFELQKADKDVQDILYCIQKTILIKQAKILAMEKAKEDFKSNRINSTIIGALTARLNQVKTEKGVTHYIQQIKNNSKREQCRKLQFDVIDKIIWRTKLLTYKKEYIHPRLIDEVGSSDRKGTKHDEFYTEIMLSYLAQYKYEGRKEAYGRSRSNK